MLSVNPGQMQDIFNTSVRQYLECVVQQKMILPPRHPRRGNTWNNETYGYTYYILNPFRLTPRDPDDTPQNSCYVCATVVCRASGHEFFICNSIVFLTSARHARQIYRRPVLVRTHGIVHNGRSHVVQNGDVSRRHCKVDSRTD